MLSCIQYRYVQSCNIIFKVVLYSDSVVADMKNAPTLSLIKKVPDSRKPK